MVTLVMSMLPNHELKTRLSFKQPTFSKHTTLGPPDKASCQGKKKLIGSVTLLKFSSLHI